MASDDRNFRYGYYEKVGFGGIEEKRSLEILLREKPPDLLSRLSQLTSRFSVSANQRKQIWQLLLNVTDPENRITVMRQEIQRQIVRDIINALVLMHLTDVDVVNSVKVDYSSTGHPRLILLIYLFESKQLNLDFEQQLHKSEIVDLLAISKVLSQEFLQPNTEYYLEDNYWIYKNFISLVNANFGLLVETYERFMQHLSKEDKTLHQHLVKNGIIRQLMSQPRLLHSSHVPNCSINLKNKIAVYRPIITWFTRLFAGIIHQTLLIRVLDKVIGCLVHGTRPFYVLLSLSKALMTSLRESLLELNSAEELTKLLLMPLSIELSEKIVLKALSN